MDKILDKILKEQGNVIVTGSNSVGKSFLAFEIMRKNAEEREQGRKVPNFYFIGVANQTFKLYITTLKSLDNYLEITKYRLLSLRTKNRDIKDWTYEAKSYDSYADFDTKSVASLIGEKFIHLMKSSNKKNQLKKALGEFGITVKESLSNTQEALKSELYLEIEGQRFTIGGSKDLSSGYQSILRLFTELFLLRDGYKENFIIFLDEISKSLDSKNSLKLIGVLEKYFPNYQFIITTHSYDLILGTKNSKILRVENQNVVDYFEDSYFETVDQVRTIVFGIEDNLEELDEKEKILNKIGFLIENLTTKKSDYNFRELENYISDVKKHTEQSNQIKVMWEYAKEILEEYRGCL